MVICVTEDNIINKKHNCLNDIMVTESANGAIKLGPNQGREQ